MEKGRAPGMRRRPKSGLSHSDEAITGLGNAQMGYGCFVADLKGSSFRTV
jgi:hypothetical protein